MFFFLRRRRLHSLSAALGAIVFTFSGFSVGHLNHVNFYVATMVLPWLLVAIDAFVSKPTLRRATIMAAVAAIIPLSGHAQIALYTLTLAATAGVIFAAQPILAHLSPAAGGAPPGQGDRTRGRRWLFKLIGLILLAAVLSISLASFSILPLFEFLPYSDRAEALSQEELFEFSYPPAHAITLILPYFFGDHENYWGAKNFQELAAYVGILPLLLAGTALTRWPGKRTLRLLGALLIVIGITSALGMHSPFYRWLIEQKIITSLSIPARFVLFFDVGIAILSALGLHDLIIAINRPKKTSHLFLSIASGLVLTAILLTPFLIQTNSDLNFVKHLKLQLTTLALVASSIILWLFGQISYRHPLARRVMPIIILTATSLTLLYYGWQYNPLTADTSFTPSSPWQKPLIEYMSSHNTPPRLLSRPALLGDQ